MFAERPYVNKYNTLLTKLSLTIIVLQNICLKKEGFHFLKRMLFCCFNHMEGILHTCSHISFPKKCTSTSHFFRLLHN